MKCGYTKCKLGGEVSKEEGIKVGTRWFHKECDYKREVKHYCTDKLSSVGMITKLTNSFLSKMIDDENCDMDYLQFVVTHVVDNKLKLSNPYGVKYYMGNWQIEKLYAEKVKIDVSKSLTEKVEYDTADETTFIPPQAKTPSYLKIL